ncbi:Arc family DNA-binding protein [Devosia crocina]|uniref:Arc family DNA-binding protein n=1 Tax=Devosia crocina TaxID=429728 RepID=UPI000B89CD7A|nr:Arc family DNA-binding protein [Devosia crocina]
MDTDRNKNVEGFSLRIPSELRDRLRLSARENRRSLNAEILVLLEQALPHTKKAEAAVAAPAH